MKVNLILNDVQELQAAERRTELRMAGWSGVSAGTFRGAFFQLLLVTGRSSHVELPLFQAWAPLSEFTD